MRNYQYSESFAQLKKIEEKVKTNYTSLQYLQTLDSFIWLALTPIADACPILLTNYFAKMTGQQSIKSNRKLSSDDRTRLPIHLFNMVTATKPADIIAHAREMYLNRGVLFGFLSLFLKRANRFAELQYITRHTTETTTELGALTAIMQPVDGETLYRATLQVTYWQSKALWWKEIIMEKYTRRSIMEAQRAYTEFSHAIDLDDIIQVYLLVTNRAINRCDARLGVLTSFIENWFKSARGQVMNLVAATKNQSFDQLSEDRHELLGSVMPDTQGELYDHITWKAHTIDRAGYVRAVIGIPERLDKTAIAILERYRLPSQPKETA